MSESTQGQALAGIASDAFAGQHVVVTGGGNGIGRALAEEFAAGGARVVVADREAALGRRSAASVGGLAVGCDVGDPDAVERLVETAVRAYGPIDVFCSNAGYTDPAPGDLARALTPGEASWTSTCSARVGGRLVVPEMLKRGGGKLLQTISSAALIAGPSGPGYTLTKHGALGFRRVALAALRRCGIGVTCLCPNAVYTGMFGRTPDEPIPTDVLLQRSLSSWVRC